MAILNEPQLLGTLRAAVTLWCSGQGYVDPDEGSGDRVPLQGLPGTPLVAGDEVEESMLVYRDYSDHPGESGREHS